MTIIRKWYCICTGKPEELGVVDTLEGEAGEPTCRRCGASPSSDPRRTVTYHDADDGED